jgi:hypothetical protein
LRFEASEGARLDHAERQRRYRQQQLRIPEHRDQRFRPNVITYSGHRDQWFRGPDHPFRAS